MVKWSEIIIIHEGIGSRFGRVYAIARHATDSLSVRAREAVESWQHANWATGRLAKAHAGNSDIMQEITQAFAPVRAALQDEFGDTVPLYRYHKAGTIDGRQLYSWSAARSKAAQFSGGKLSKVLSDSDIDAAIATYQRTGFVTVGSQKYLRMKDDPSYYMIYDRRNQPITDGDDLRGTLEADNADRKASNARLSSQGQLLSADVPLDRIIWIPANALSMEVIVTGDPETLGLK